MSQANLVDYRYWYLTNISTSGSLIWLSLFCVWERERERERDITTCLQAADLSHLPAHHGAPSNVALTPTGPGKTVSCLLDCWLAGWGCTACKWMKWLSQCGRASSAELGVGSVRGPSELCQTVGQCGHTPLISQPNISTLQVRLQTQSATNPLYRGTWDCVGKTVRKEGLRALYKGKNIHNIHHTINLSTPSSK